MGDCKNIDDILNRNGTDQDQRFIESLNPENLELHDFDVEDWILFAYNFAKHINYFDVKNDSEAVSNWQELFGIFGLTGENIPDRTDKNYITLKENIIKILAEFESESTLTPQLTLFVCFLKLLELSKKRMNLLTKRHLDFFYKEILQIKKLPPVADKVHVIFELAKKVVDNKIEKGTELNGGKDNDGNTLLYKTSEELVANQASVSQLKSLFYDTNLGEIKSSEIANSLDGKGEALDKDSNFWLPFGYTSDEKNYTELDDAKIGFAIASPLFDLKEGERNVEVKITFDETLSYLNSLGNDTDPLNAIKVYCSGEKSWLGPFTLSENIPSNSEINPTSGIIGKVLRIVFQIPKDTEAVTSYDQKLLGQNYSTSSPVVRFLFNTSAEKGGHQLIQSLLKKKVKSIAVKVDVREVTSLELESDSGTLNTKKPFYPFTIKPVRGSGFTINYPEMFAKKWKTANINIEWKNTPITSFVDHYFAYKKDYLNETSKSTFESGMFYAKESEKLVANQPESPKATTTDAADNETSDQLNRDLEDLIVQDDNYFTASLSILNKEKWENKNQDVVLFTPKTIDSEKYYNSGFSASGSAYDIEKSGPFLLKLNTPFLHSLYPRLYTLALLSEKPDTLIPNDPYTPFADSISLNYVAEETTDFTLEDEQSYKTNRIKLFHDDAFGQYEEHSYLRKKAKNDTILANTYPIESWIIPEYCQGGELYIGLENAETKQQVSLLIEVLEGSENPKADSFSGKQKVGWWILCDNQWKDLELDLLKNNIDNFLSSGIVKFSIPKQATKSNTRFAANYIWIKAKMHKTYDAVCKVIDIKSQAVLAEFGDNGNELSHLENGIPASTISKLITRVPQIKKVSQPFNSFNGKLQESDETYYRRISERLRHKSRAITLWDYEHLVLQEFPEVFKVKCLNHTSDNSFLSPGDVTLVVIPDIVNKNVFDIYEPRLSKASLNRIQKYVNQQNSLHVETKVINPEYEQVVVKVNVKFHQQYDENFYTKQLNQDITKFLSPWAFDNTEDISFGMELHRSVIIDYLEKLYYVDYLEELEIAIHPDDIEDIELLTEEDYLEKLDLVEILTTSSPKHILVSAKEHLIYTEVKTCTDENIEETEACQ